VGVRVLPHIERLQVESERAQRPLQRRQARICDDSGAHRVERIGDNLQVRLHILGPFVRGIGVRADGPAHVVDRDADAGNGVRRGARGELAAHRTYGAAVGHVAPRRLVVAARDQVVRQRDEIIRHLDQPARQAQLVLEKSQLLVVIILDDGGGA
jgi:hypothetical protein